MTATGSSPMSMAPKARALMQAHRKLNRATPATTLNCGFCRTASSHRANSPSPIRTPSADENWTPACAWEDDFQPLDGEESTLGGYGYHEWTEDLAEILDAKLPHSAPGEQHVLLFDVAGVRVLEDWFGDSGHLQAWIRASDRDRRAFENVWCIIRTDWRQPLSGRAEPEARLNGPLRAKYIDNLTNVQIPIRIHQKCVNPILSRKSLWCRSWGQRRARRCGR